MPLAETSQEVPNPEQLKIDLIVKTLQAASKNPEISVVFIIGLIVEQLADYGAKKKEIDALFKHPAVEVAITEACKTTIQYAIDSVEYSPKDSCKLSEETVKNNFDKDLEELSGINEVTDIRAISNGIREKIRIAHEEANVPATIINKYFTQPRVLAQLATQMKALIPAIAQFQMGSLLQRYQNSLALRGLSDSLNEEVYDYHLRSNSPALEARLSESTLKKVYGSPIKDILKEHPEDYGQLTPILKELYHYGIELDTIVRLVAHLEFEIENDEHIQKNQKRIPANHSEQAQRRYYIERYLDPMWQEIKAAEPETEFSQYNFFDKEPAIDAIERISAKYGLPDKFVFLLNWYIEGTPTLEIALKQLLFLRVKNKEHYQKLSPEQKAMFTQINVGPNNHWIRLNNKTVDMDLRICKAIIELCQHGKTNQNWYGKTAKAAKPGTSPNLKNSPLQYLKNLGIRNIDNAPILRNHLHKLRQEAYYDFYVRRDPTAAQSQELPPIEKKAEKTNNDFSDNEITEAQEELKPHKILTKVPVSALIISYNETRDYSAYKEREVDSSAIICSAQLKDEKQYRIYPTFHYGSTQQHLQCSAIPELNIEQKEITEKTIQSLIEDYGFTEEDMDNLRKNAAEDKKILLEIEYAQYLNFDEETARNNEIINKVLKIYVDRLIANPEVAIATLNRIYICTPDSKETISAFEEAVKKEMGNHEGLNRLVNTYILPVIFKQLEAACQPPAGIEYSTPAVPLPSSESL